MNSWKKSSRFAAVIVGACAFTASAYAEDFIQAYGWQTQESYVDFSGGATGGSPATLLRPLCSANASAACTSANADVSFTTSGLNLGQSGFPDGGTISQWLASSTFTLNNLVDNTPNATMDPTIWQFTGTASFTNGQSFSVGHDDGATFIINGATVLDAPGPTSPTIDTFTYNGPTGNFSFEFDYAECCGGPAELTTDLVGPANGVSDTPEPFTFMLLGTGLAGLGAIRRFKRTV